MQSASRSVASVKTSSSSAPARRAARPTAPLPLDSRPVAPPDVRLYQPALKAGAGLPQLAIAVADHERWHGDQRMFEAIARAVLQHRDRFKAFGLRVPPADLEGRPPVIAVGDTLPPSLRVDERENPIGGLHRGAACCGFHDRVTLEAAIRAVALYDGQVVALVGGSGAYRLDAEPGTRIITMPTVIALWRRRFDGLGRGVAWPSGDHADFP